MKLSFFPWAVAVLIFLLKLVAEGMIVLLHELFLARTASVHDASDSTHTRLLLHVEFGTTEGGTLLLRVHGSILLPCQMRRTIERYLGSLHLGHFPGSR